MNDIIQLLPDHIANQIAAGEVVQRPASVVKELLENAIDAEATAIKVLIKDAGKTLIQVIDNGKGMSDTDARLSFERHATSKLHSTEDLFQITTKGFRGEALASIAAIAQVEMKSRREEDELGTLLVINGSEVQKQEPEAVPMGTSVSVRNIFYNVPARRNFLKSNPVEMRHIIEEFQRVALAHEQVAFSLYQNDMEVYQLKGGKLSQRIIGLFGKGHQQQLVPCAEETTRLKITGYVGKPENAKKTRGEQYFFVNHRFIKNNYLNHAVMNAYEGLLADGHYPFYTLFIDLDPKHIDVNVHPTKTEIKFDDERTVYGIVRAAVKQALGAHNITPSLDFESDVNFEAIIKSRELAPSRAERDYGQMKSVDRQKLKNWEQLYEGSMEESKIDLKHDLPALTLGSAVNQPKVPTFESTALMQISGGYLVTPVKSGIMWVDVQAAFERVLYEKYLKCLEQRSGVSQQMLFPQTMSINPADFTLLMDAQQDIEAMGFILETFGKSDVIIRGVPVDASNKDPQNLIEALIEQLKNFSNVPGNKRREHLAQSMARKVATKTEKVWEEAEMRGLIDQLFGCQYPNYAPSGNRTHVIMDGQQIENLFN